MTIRVTKVELVIFIDFFKVLQTKDRVILSVVVNSQGKNACIITGPFIAIQVTDNCNLIHVYYNLTKL